MVQSRGVPAKDGIRVSTETLLNPGDHRQKVEFVRVPNNSPDEYGKMVESV